MQERESKSDDKYLKTVQEHVAEYAAARKERIQQFFAHVGAKRDNYITGLCSEKVLTQSVVSSPDSISTLSVTT